MARQAPIAIRISPEVRDALKQAAADDSRSIASFVEHEMRRILVDRGYLPAAPAKPARKKGKAQ